MISRRPLSRRTSPAVASPKMTIIVMTYNHAPFIKEALDSVLMQETSFECEVIVIDDCSTDGTSDIVRAYQKAHPHQIRMVLAEVNRCDNAEFMKAVQACRGEYLALLDGDDYWTSPDKLQRQAEYLDRHPECAISFHNVRIISDDANQAPRESLPSHREAFSTLEDLLEGCFVSTCAAVLRRDALTGFPSWYTNDDCPDWSLFVMAAQHGRLGYLKDVMAVYRQHSGGFWTGLRRREQSDRIIQFYENLCGYLPGEYAPKVRVMLARQCYDVAVEEQQAGNRDAARRYMEKCLRAEPDVRRVKWSLRAAGGSIAALVCLPGDGDGVRIQIERAASRAGFDVQLNQPYLSVKVDERYSVRFRARADALRSIFVGFAQAQEPWMGLGLYERVELSREWQPFQVEFVAAADEGNGRIHFDLGESAVSVELTSVSVRRVADDEPIDPRLLLHAGS